MLSGGLGDAGLKGDASEVNNVIKNIGDALAQSVTPQDSSRRLLVLAMPKELEDDMRTGLMDAAIASLGSSYVDSDNVLESLQVCPHATHHYVNRTDKNSAVSIDSGFSWGLCILYTVFRPL